MGKISIVLVKLWLLDHRLEKLRHVLKPLMSDGVICTPYFVSDCLS